MNSLFLKKVALKFLRPECTSNEELVGRAIKGRRTQPNLLSGICLNDENNQPSNAANAILREGSALL